MDGLGVYSSSTYLDLKALAPADVFYTTGLSDVAPALSVGDPAVAVPPADGSTQGVQARRTVTVNGAEKRFGPYFALGTAAVTDGADASTTWGKYACPDAQCS